MQSSQWLQGGPLLEVSFLLELKEQKMEAIKDIITRLSTSTYKVEIVDDNMDEMIDLFDKGYPYDEEYPKTNTIHSLSLRLYIYLSKKRKATLQIVMVSSNTIMVNFSFFGSEFDAPEWDQLGIKKEEVTDFTNFLKELYSIFEFKVGAVAIEEDVLQLFDFDETYPNECYRYENLSPNYLFEKSAFFIDIIWNEKQKKLKDVPYHYKRIDKEGIHIKVGAELTGI